MKNYEPSANFVSRVMNDVRAYEASKRTLTRMERLLSSGHMRYALAACGALFALDNIFRVAFLFFSPAICR